jgi:hypothetical protein
MSDSLSKLKFKSTRKNDTRNFWSSREIDRLVDKDHVRSYLVSNTDETRRQRLLLTLRLTDNSDTNNEKNKENPRNGTTFSNNSVSFSWFGYVLLTSSDPPRNNEHGNTTAYRIEERLHVRPNVAQRNGHNFCRIREPLAGSAAELILFWTRSFEHWSEDIFFLDRTLRYIASFAIPKWLNCWWKLQARQMAN